MTIEKRDVLAILSSITAGASVAVTMGLGDTVDALAPGYGKRVLAVITLVSIIAMTLSRVLSNPSPPAGTVSAVIPPGTIPVVAPAPGTGLISVAHVANDAILAVSTASYAEPHTTKGASP